jgi:hypothetical protein
MSSQVQPPTFGGHETGMQARNVNCQVLDPAFGAVRDTATTRACEPLLT